MAQYEVNGKPVELEGDEHAWPEIKAAYDSQYGQDDQKKESVDHNIYPSMPGMGSPRSQKRNMLGVEEGRNFGKNIAAGAMQTGENIASNSNWQYGNELMGTQPQHDPWKIGETKITRPYDEMVGLKPENRNEFQQSIPSIGLAMAAPNPFQKVKTGYGLLNSGVRALGEGGVQALVAALLNPNSRKSSAEEAGKIGAIGSVAIDALKQGIPALKWLKTAVPGLAKESDYLEPYLRSISPHMKESEYMPRYLQGKKHGIHILPEEASQSAAVMSHAKTSGKTANGLDIAQKFHGERGEDVDRLFEALKEKVSPNKFDKLRSERYKQMKEHNVSDVEADKIYKTRPTYYTSKGERRAEPYRKSGQKIVTENIHPGYEETVEPLSSFTKRRDPNISIGTTKIPNKTFPGAHGMEGVKPSDETSRFYKNRNEKRIDKTVVNSLGKPVEIKSVRQNFESIINPDKRIAQKATVQRAMKRMEDSPIYKDEFSGMSDHDKYRNGRYLNLLKRNLQTEAKALEKGTQSTPKNTDEATRAWKAADDITSFLKENNPYAKTALKLGQWNLAKGKVEQLLSNERKGGKSFVKALQDYKVRKDLEMMIPQSGRRMLGDTYDILSNINRLTPKQLAGTLPSSMTNGMPPTNVERLAEKILTAFKNGKHDVAAINFGTNKEWPTILKEYKSRGDKTNAMGKYIQAIIREEGQRRAQNKKEEK